VSASIVTEAVGIVRLLVELASIAIRDIHEGRPERVGEILPPTMRTTLAKALADRKAEEKFFEEPKEPTP